MRLLLLLSAAAACAVAQRNGTDVGGLTPSQIEVVNHLSDAASALSVLGSVFILVMYVRLAHLRTFAFKLVAMLSFTDLCNQIADFVQPSAGEMESMRGGGPITPACYTQAVGASFFELASVLWTCAIAAMLYMSVFMRMSGEDVARKWIAFCAVCYGLPAVLTIIPAFDAAYGPAGSWCWIVESKNYWRFLQFYAWLWAAFAFNAVTYWRVLRLLKAVSSKDTHNDGTAQRIRALVSRLQLYPFILLIVWFFASVNRIYEAASGGQQVFALFLLQRVFSSSQGFLNAFAYGFSGGVREALGEMLSPYLPAACTRCCARSATESDLVTGKRSSLEMHRAAVLPRGASGARTQDDDDDDDIGDDDVRVHVPQRAHPAGIVHVDNALPRALNVSLVASSMPSVALSPPMGSSMNGSLLDEGRATRVANIMRPGATAESSPG